MTHDFMEEEIEQYPALFEQLHRTFSSLTTSQAAKLGLVISLVLPGWDSDGEMAYIRAIVAIIREQLDLNPDRDRILNQMADMLGAFNTKDLMQDGDA